ncbi:hypothetical protein pipiens_014339 [Culex pipiens pipiens]|uniref:Kinesin motor domain-containing protein n=1 Tax=Culex pipiens pipiens TaxID=38569 RepID=A0ABD1CUZ4_CULPP
MPEESKSEGEIENVRVVVRVRPMDKNELDSGSQNIIKTDKSNRCITVYKPNANSSEPPKVYFFDNVFGEESTQVRNQICVCFSVPPSLFQTSKCMQQ